MFYDLIAAYWPAALVELTGGAAGAGKPKIGPRGQKSSPGAGIRPLGPEIRARRLRFPAPGAEFRLPGIDF